MDGIGLLRHGPYCVGCGGNRASGHAPGCIRHDYLDTHVSPDCREGKHRACHKDAWCLMEDSVTKCECPCHVEGES